MSAGVNLYGSIAAEIYDLDKPVGSRWDAPFYVERLRGVQGPVLEPACGSGRVLIPLLQAGLDVTGFDASEEMIANCRARCAEAGLAPDLTRQRWEDFAYDRAFAAIAVPAGSFILIDDYARALRVLRRFREHLAPGGLLILDIEGLAYLQPEPDARRRWTAANGDMVTLESTRSLTDPFTQRVEQHLRYERWRGGVLLESQLEIMAYRYWSFEEAKLTLASVGFEIEAIHGDYTAGRPLRARDRVWTFEVRRAG
jgi:hypothetical protein